MLNSFKLVLTLEKMANFCCTQIVTQILIQIDHMLKYLCLHQIWKQIQILSTDLKGIHIWIMYFKYVLTTNFATQLKITFLRIFV
jgi:hypothetical protein